MSAAAEAQPRRGPKGAAPRDSVEADTRYAHVMLVEEAEG